MLALRAAQVFDGTVFTGPATVLVEGDRIIGVEDARHEPPADCPVTSYDGTLLPGLVDCHVHLVGDATPLCLERAGVATDDELDLLITTALAQQVAGGVTTVVDLGDVRYRTLEARALPGLPRVLAAGPPITTTGGHCHYLGGVAEGVDGVRRAVAEHLERGVDVIKVMASGGMLTVGSDMFGTQFEPEELRALVDAAHAGGRQTTAHAHSVRGIRHAVACGVDSIEHFTGITEDGLVIPDDLLDTLADSGTRVCPTFGFDESRLPPPELMPVNLRLVMGRLGLDVATMGATRAGHLARVRDRGVTVVSGVDAGAGPPKPHGYLAHAVLELLEAGYPIGEAVATATSVAADAYGLGEITGRVKAGLAADLLVVDGDVALDPTALTRPVAVLVRGQAATS